MFAAGKVECLQANVMSLRVTNILCVFRRKQSCLSFFKRIGNTVLHA